MARCFLLFCFLSTLSCRTDSFERVPPQIQLREPGQHLVLTMRTGAAPVPWASIVEGIRPGDPKTDFSWTGPAAQFLFSLPGTKQWTCKCDFFVSDTVLKQTGAQTLRVSVNGKVVHTMRLEKSGSYDFAAPVPAAVLHAGEPASVTLAVQPVYRGTDGVGLGILLHQCGFHQAGML